MRKGEAPFDWWTALHFGSGAALGLLGLHWGWALAIIIGFEFLEAALRRIRKDGRGLFEYESWPNIVVDVLAALVAYLLARYALPFEGPLA